MKVWFVTRNPHKVREVRAVLAPYGIDVEVSEERKFEVQADSLERVAYEAAKRLPPDKIYIVEDAGLFIDALKGFPGVYSSYVLDTIGLKGILKLMEGIENRKAKFVSVIACRLGDRVELFKGEVRGRIAEAIRGNQGFGYDPIFVPEGYERTFGEMSMEEKNRLSHRGRAARKLADFLLTLDFK